MLFIQVWNHGLGVNGEALARALRDACFGVEDWPELRMKNAVVVRVVLDGPADEGPVCIMMKYTGARYIFDPVCKALMEAAEKFFAETVKRPRDVFILPEKGQGIWA